MEGLVGFVLRSIAEQPDQVQVNTVEGKASVLYEVDLAESDRERLLADDSALLGAVQAVISASAGKRKAVLELLDHEAASDEE